MQIVNEAWVQIPLPALLSRYMVNWGQWFSGWVATCTVASFSRWKIYCANALLNLQPTLW